MADICISYQRLRKFSEKIFEKIGSGSEHAAIAASALLSADLRGIDSHGIARLAGYIRLWENGRANTKPALKITYETPSTAVVDGDRGLGLVVAPFAMQVAIEKAKVVGTGWVCVNNSNHFGIAAHHALLAVKEGMIGIVMTNASPLVAPTFSTERLLGTNPICVAIPAGNQPPFVADLATATASNGKLEILQRANLETPTGWIQDAEGVESTNPGTLQSGGSLLPLGGDRVHGSHKGYALGSIVDIFCGVLSGANYGPWVPPFPAYLPMPSHMPGKGIGHFFGAMRIDAFRPAIEFTEHMDRWIERFRQAKPAAGQGRVLIPGDPERESEISRLEKGIPLVQAVWNDLVSLGKKFDLVC